MSEELIGFLVKNLFSAVVFAFILSWVVSFLLKKDMYLEMKKAKLKIMLITDMLYGYSMIKIVKEYCLFQKKNLYLNLGYMNYLRNQ